jgi:hypothetical protein
VSPKSRCGSRRPGTHLAGFSSVNIRSGIPPCSGIAFTGLLGLAVLSFPAHVVQGVLIGAVALLVVAYVAGSLIASAAPSRKPTRMTVALEWGLGSGWSNLCAVTYRWALPACSARPAVDRLAGWRAPPRTALPGFRWDPW